MPETDPIVERARRLAPMVRERAPEGEQLRRLPPDLVASFVCAGMFRLALPRSFGGEEVTLRTFVSVVEELARSDGSAGWCAMIAGIGGLFSAVLPEDGAREVFPNADVVAGGVLAPLGRARPVDGGYVVSGRWPFASGCQHCQWLSGGSLVVEDPGSETASGGLRRWLMPVFPASAASIVDTWDVSGLRGTGSHDIEVRDLFVPQRHTFELPGSPREKGPLYRVPVFGVLAVGVAAVALGVARGALEEIQRLARAKVPLGMVKTLANRHIVQIEIASAEAAIRSARALLYESIEGIWDLVSREASISLDDRAGLRLACTNATLRAAEVVDAAYAAGGSASLYATSPLQRQLRDVRAITQHFSTAPTTLETIGRVLLGAPAETAFL